MPLGCGLVAWGKDRRVNGGDGTLALVLLLLPG